MDVQYNPEDAALVSQYRWHLGGGSKRQGHYAATVIDGKTVYMHRLIMNAPPHMQVDHINRNRLDNRRANLRLVTKTQNMQNMKRDYGSSQFKGVSWNKMRKKWQAHIMKNRKSMYLGLFLNETDAARAYDQAAKVHFGECALLNFTS